MARNISAAHPGLPVLLPAPVGSITNYELELDVNLEQQDILAYKLDLTEENVSISTDDWSAARAPQPHPKLAITS